MRILLLLLALSLTSPNLWAQVRITPSRVYTQAIMISKEINLLKRHFKLKAIKPYRNIKADLRPRHAWQKSYALLVKINVLRKKNNLPRFTVNSIEPVLNLDPLLTFEQTQRILTELRILKTRLGIRKKISPTKEVFGKEPIDVFNQLHRVSLQMEVLNHEAINPTYVFAEVLRIYEDITLIASEKLVEDNSFPPEKLKELTPKNSLLAAFELMAEIQEIQKTLGIERSNFTPFMKDKNVLPSDVFNMVGMCLAELQTIKAHMEISNLTLPAEYQEEKSPADVHQLLLWSLRKLHLVHLER